MSTVQTNWIHPLITLPSYSMPAHEVYVIAWTSANEKPSLSFASVRYVRYGENYIRTDACSVLLTKTQRGIPWAEKNVEGKNTSRVTQEKAWEPASV